MDAKKQEVEGFYDGFAVNYHRMFNDWEAEIQRHTVILTTQIRKFWGETKTDILDCTCGIGTQTIGLAQAGYNVTGTDISGAALARAKEETTKRGLNVVYKKMDLRSLKTIDKKFSVIISADNSLPNLLTDEDLTFSLKQIRDCLKSNGMFIATIRDYNQLIKTRPQMTTPTFFKSTDEESITFQVWNWIADNIYELHQYASVKQDRTWKTFHHVTPYRALQREELSMCLEKAGMKNINWSMPDESGFHQPIVVATRSKKTLPLVLG